MNLNKIIREEIAQLNETAGKNMPDAFFDQVVQKLGGTPTEEKRRFFRAWKRAEGTNAKNNPLATTWDKQVNGQTDFNTAGVKNYPDQETGVSATVNTLTKGIGATAYKDLVAKLQSNTTADDLANTPSAFKSWSGKPYYVANVLGAKQTTDKEETSVEIGDNIDWKSILNYFQIGLDVFGIIPGWGDIGDLINTLIYVTRAVVEKDDTYYIDAGLSAIAIIPAYGSVVALPLKAMFKGLRKFPTGTKVLKTALKNIDDSAAWTDVFSLARQNNLIDQKTLTTLSSGIRSANKQLVTVTDKVAKQFSIPSAVLQKPRTRLVSLLDAMAEGAAKERKLANITSKTSKLDLPKWVKDVVKLPVRLTKASTLGPLKTLSGYRRAFGPDTKSISNVASNSFDKKFLFRGGFDRFINTAMPGTGVQQVYDKLPSLLKKLDPSLYKTGMSPTQAKTALSDLFKTYNNRSAKSRKSIMNDFNDWSKQTNLNNGITPADYISSLRKSYISNQFGLGKLTRSNFIPTFREAAQRITNSGGRALVENLNIFKIIPRLLRLSDVLADSDNELVRSIGEDLGTFSYVLWESTGLLALMQSMDNTSPDYEEQKELAKEATQKVFIQKEKILDTVKQIPDSEYNALSEEERAAILEVLDLE